MIAIILAGGSGTRFWPLSRRHRPKQLLTLWGDRPMIAETVERLQPHTPLSRIYVVCGPHLVEGIRQALPELPAQNLIVEPAARNTAPAIALAALHARRHHGDEVMGVFPSDHYIGQPREFLRCVRLAEESAAEGGIVTLGIAPTRPETGYGYIHFEEREHARSSAMRVKAFVEKPSAEAALRYLRSGDYLWNAGMFFMRPSALLGELERHMPQTYARLSEIDAALGQDHAEAATAAAFERMEATSIDYGVMERAQEVKVIPATFSWSDVGHWGAMRDLGAADDAGNLIHADVALHEVRDTTLYSTSGRLIAAVGVEDLVVVDTPDALLVLSRKHAQEVREIVSLLEARGRDELL